MCERIYNGTHLCHKNASLPSNWRIRKYRLTHSRITVSKFEYVESLTKCHTLGGTNELLNRCPRLKALNKHKTSLLMIELMFQTYAQTHAHQ